MIRYSWKEILISVMLVGLFVIVINKFSGTREEFVCDRYVQFKKTEYKGIVREKRIDEHDHNNHIVILENDKSSSDRMNLSFDRSPLFTNVKPGDTLVKEADSSYVILNNTDKYQIDYGVKCND